MPILRVLLRPRLWTWLTGLALYVAIVGSCQFAFSESWMPGPCTRLDRHWDRLVDWLRSGKEPLGVYFLSIELKRLAATAAVIVLLSVAFGWSILLQRPFRFHVRLRTQMIAIALLACAWVGGKEIWIMWDRFDDHINMIDYCSGMSRALLTPDLPIDPEELRMTRELADQYKAAAEEHRKAIWRPWSQVEVKLPL